MSDNNFEVGVVGLGYVGLTLAVVLADAGVKVLGVEKRREVVAGLNNYEPHFVESGLDVLLKQAIESKKLTCVSQMTDEMRCNTYIITVGTPLDSDGQARLDMIKQASKEVADNMPDGALVIVRSTVKVGTTRNIVQPVLDVAAKSYDIAMCPERTLEGNALKELRTIPQILGADDEAILDRAENLFRKLTNTMVRVSSLEAAEIVKLTDNSFRDVQFAFANEIARACEAFGVNAYEVIASGKLGYARTNVALPGLVGGPCLEKDPHIFQQSVNSKNGTTLELISSARMINERQPYETVHFIADEMQRRNLHNVKVAVLGMAFKGYPATDDLRGAMSIKVVDSIKKVIKPCRDIDIHIYDPVASAEALSEHFKQVTIRNQLNEAVEGACVVIITNNHSEFKQLPFDTLTSMMHENGFVYDYWNNFSHLAPAKTANRYFAVGNIGRVEHK